MTEELLPPDSEAAVRNYLRQDAGVTALVGNRVFFGTDNAAYPWVAVQRVGGGVAVNDLANVDGPMIQLDCYGGPRNKAAAWGAAAAVIAALRKIETQPWRDAATSLTLYGSTVDWVWLPDPESEVARYVITCVLSVAAS